VKISFRIVISDDAGFQSAFNNIAPVNTPALKMYLALGDIGRVNEDARFPGEACAPVFVSFAS
jgi:hypothetical protein